MTADLCALETKRAAEATAAAVRQPAPYVGGVCVVSDVQVGALTGVGRAVKVTGLNGSPLPVPVKWWSKTFDTLITTTGTALTGQSVVVFLFDRQPYISDVAVSAPIVTTSVGG